MTTVKYKAITDIDDFKGRTVLLRSELNAPLARGKVSDDSRLKASLDTIYYLLKRNAKVIILAHASTVDTSLRISLEPVFDYLKKNIQVSFIRDYSHGEAKRVIDALKPGSALLFENLRFDSREEENDEDFARMLASYADYYVNDAFPVAHRNHASIVGIPKFLPSFAGIQFDSEYKALSKALNPEHPFLFILGGAKFTTKLPLAEKFLDIADSVFLGGALLNPILKAKGYEIGKSLMPKEDIDSISIIAQHKNLLVPEDVLCVQNGESGICAISEISPDGAVFDIGPQAIQLLKDEINKAKFILWNGPLGDFERGFKKSTDEIADAIRNSSAMSIVGGGDSLASLETQSGFGFVSTAGGAMLDFLANGSLPGIDALE